MASTAQFQLEIRGVEKMKSMKMLGMGRVGLLLLALATFAEPFVSRAEARAVVHTGRVNAYAGPRGAAVSGPNRTAVTTRRGAVATGPHGNAAVRRPVGAIPGGYVRTLPVGYRPVIYRGANAYYAGGVYYRRTVYNGTTVYVPIQ